jgi:hypothetical protein
MTTQKDREAVPTPDEATTPQAELAAFIDQITVPADFQRDFYAFIKVFTDWLDAAGIPYFLHSGTALGQVRHRGFIPWDDDFDIMIEAEHEERLAASIPELKQYGILINPKHAGAGHYQFHFRHPLAPSSSKRYYCFDIFIGKREEVDGRTVLHYRHADFHRWFKDRYCPVSDVYPLERGDFGPLRLWCMRDPSDYFRRSNFRTDEATLHVHLVDQAWLAERIAHFQALGAYPIRDPEILSRQIVTDFGDVPLRPLDEWKLR